MATADSNPRSDLVDTSPPPDQPNDDSNEQPSNIDHHKVQFDGAAPWTSLSKSELIDKIKGLIYGQALGDAMGLATEFLNKKQVLAVYGKTFPLNYEFIQDGHRSRWDKGDWTDDTDQMLLILLSIVEKNGEVDEIDFAKKLRDWMLNGFPQFGDKGGMGIGMTVGRVLRHQLFETEPHSAAKDVWEMSGRYLAANGAVMRTSILGVLDFNDIQKVISNTKKCSLVTHADPRCTASCVAVTTAIALLLQGKFDVSKSKELDKLVDTAIELANECIPQEVKKQMKEHILANDLKSLKLDDAAKIGYTFKTMGCGFYGLRKGGNDFKKTLIDVVMEAGDADTNAAVCGAMLGCKVGYSKLPHDLIQFPHRQWLNDRVDEFLNTIGLQ